MKTRFYVSSLVHSFVNSKPAILTFLNAVISTFTAHSITSYQNGHLHTHPVKKGQGTLKPPPEKVKSVQISINKTGISTLSIY